MTRTGSPSTEIPVDSVLEGAFGDRGDNVSLCSLRAGSGLFGIDTRQIREILGKTVPQPVPLAPPYVAGIVPYRGEALTTLSLRALLGLDPSPAANCVLVLDDHEAGEFFGLIVDTVGGVVAIARDTVQPTPSTLDARSLALFDGAVEMDHGLMVLLDPARLSPTCLAKSGLFDSPAQFADARIGVPK
jgi:purine-binding chemotaxis protein CheW